jgi:hypothetical protein
MVSALANGLERDGVDGFVSVHFSLNTEFNIFWQWRDRCQAMA